MAAGIIFTGIAVKMYLGEQSGEFIGWLILTWPFVLGNFSLFLGPIALPLGISVLLRDRAPRYILIAIAIIAQIVLAVNLGSYEEECRRNCVSLATPFWVGSLFLWGIALATYLAYAAYLRESETDGEGENDY